MGTAEAQRGAAEAQMGAAEAQMVAAEAQLGAAEAQRCRVPAGGPPSNSSRVGRSNEHTVRLKSNIAVDYYLKTAKQ